MLRTALISRILYPIRIVHCSPMRHCLKIGWAEKNTEINKCYGKRRNIVRLGVNLKWLNAVIFWYLQGKGTWTSRTLRRPFIILSLTSCSLFVGMWRCQFTEKTIMLVDHRFHCTEQTGLMNAIRIEDVRLIFFSFYWWFAWIGAGFYAGVTQNASVIQSSISSS